MRRSVSIWHQAYRLTRPFTIGHGTRTVADCVHVTITQGSHRGEAACIPYARYGESIDSVMDQIESIRSALERGLSIAELQMALPAGAARNAIDCALWRIDSYQQQIPIWQLLDLPDPTLFDRSRMCDTVSVNDPVYMANQAKNMSAHIIKVKCMGDGLDRDRIDAIRQVCPSNELLIDPNESWSLTELEDYFDHCEERGVSIIEQPVPAIDDSVLETIRTSIDVCADESCHTSTDVSVLLGRYTMVNVKLDKTGGLTEAARLIHCARHAGLKVMVGCMVGPELCIQPALELLGSVDIADLDGPQFLR